MRLSLSHNANDYPFHTDIAVRIGDLAGGLHVGNHVLVSYLTEAQMQLMSHLGFPKLTVGSVMPINSDLQISYLGEGKYGDVFDVAVAIESFAERHYHVIFHVSSKQNGLAVCDARMKMMCIDTETHKTTTVPSQLIKAYSQINKG